LRSDGTAGTAASALIQGLQTHNAGEVSAAVEQLAANSADVASNNLMANGGSYADVVAAAQATAVTPAGGHPATPPAATPPAGTPPAATPPAATPPAVADVGPPAHDTHHSAGADLALHLHHMWG